MLCSRVVEAGEMTDDPQTTIQRLHAAVDRVEPMLRVALAQLQAGDYTRCIGSLRVVIDEVRKLETAAHG